MEKYVYIDGKKYRRGYTTGSTATGAAKAAALMALNNKLVEYVEIDTPRGVRLNLKVENQSFRKNEAVASVKKDGGDDKDVTHGIDIFAKVTINNSGKITIDGGIGVGRVTKKGLNITIGDAAINKVPRQMIEKEVRKVVNDLGADIIIYIPKGEEIAEKTFNPRLGIEGGISIIGTSGIVEPMSEEGWKKSLSIELKMKREQGMKNIILVPGNHGENFVEEVLNIDLKNVVRTSNFIGYMLKEAERFEFEKILLVGHLGKFVKLAGGIFHTHSKMADCRMEILVTHLALMGAPKEFLREIYICPTTEAAIELIKESGYEDVYNIIANKGKEKVLQRLDKNIEVEMIIFSMELNILGKSTGADNLLEVFK
ncbi:cobalt-precorrin-5B (C(1))-methyltransferase CbiD [Tepidibacter formicigenes]|jgi:cobalt-precorrin-5B (C1)-methyltransferase|uniref:Cobalt-precorrin-5B C(1)-methyltransferase n=1 Tax=Tepidibacter formicigenes DSM 15518 TaxID=1123349 RepID=A0A1M6RHK7_9FIRM|nr:cobalt-precorrin-5B (C(1))-methyltransferase CbiD [Tepidibacter formicigenes]SHK31955.1 cobalt-precorrin-5B (C1)-methyltransferase [Tepidibacter formicigenes DSM 15518]